MQAGNPISPLSVLFPFITIILPISFYSSTAEHRPPSDPDRGSRSLKSTVRYWTILTRVPAIAKSSLNLAKHLPLLGRERNEHQTSRTLKNFLVSSYFITIFMEARPFWSRQSPPLCTINFVVKCLSRSLPAPTSFYVCSFVILSCCFFFYIWKPPKHALFHFYTGTLFRSHSLSFSFQHPVSLPLSY